MTNRPQNFWYFSVALYGHQQVTDACLDLQNLYGVDVNMILFCYWHGSKRGELSPETMQQALAFSANWKRELVQPLRNVRQWMKLHGGDYPGTFRAQFDTLRARIKSDELAAEKFQQELLELVAMENPVKQGTAGGAGACDRNIERYFVAIRLEQNDLIANKLKTIASALQFTA